MYNKLRFYQDELLGNTLNRIQHYNMAAISENRELAQINNSIQKLREKCHALSQMKEKGYLDTEHFLEQYNRFNRDLMELDQQRDQCLRGQIEIDAKSLKRLASYIAAGPERIEQFNPLLFETLVERIDLVDKNTYRFQLLGGLKIMEHGVDLIDGK